MIGSMNVVAMAMSPSACRRRPVAVEHATMSPLRPAVIPELVTAVRHGRRGHPPAVHILAIVASLALIAGCGAPTPAATAGGQQPAGKVTLLDLTGSGIKDSTTFTTTAPWTIAYDFDCSGFAGGKGNFVVTVFNGTDLVGVAVNELAAKGASTTAQYDTGTIHLSMNSECPWHVVATQP